MSTIVFPALPGLSWSVYRKPTFATIVRKSDSNREVTAKMNSRCFYEFELNYEFLKFKNGATDLTQIQSLFLKMRGDYDTFLFEDPNDKSVTLSQIGTGNGTNRVFVLGRNTGPSFFEAVGYLNTITGVYLNGVLQSGGSYTFTAPNIITFNTAPGNGVVVTATFTYYYVCRFKDNLHQYEQFMNHLMKLRSVKFKSVVY
jgi:hypothetical protein